MLANISFLKFEAIGYSVFNGIISNKSAYKSAYMFAALVCSQQRVLELDIFSFLAARLNKLMNVTVSVILFSFIVMLFLTLNAFYRKVRNAENKQVILALS